MRYIIDSNFEFCPESCQLTTFGTENFTITLNAPASRYLELLLERRSDLVLQHDFYEYAWGDDAKSVSVNTLYQNIALLRKSLRSISKDYNTMVLTIPKQGFQFNNNFSVQQLLGVQEPIPSVNDDVEINSVSLQEMLNESPPPARWLAFKKKLKKPLIYSVIALGVMAFFQHFISSKQKREGIAIE
ncbi:winged helix-turn-helix domain-containing protein (plasmid) [Serratia sp. L9]|uniref:winged helix-turn-helix domain-containing protein n=1 Tax=Serratia sp. L9 TaxID=3423946 RepID=UPI003D679F23